VNSLTRCEPEVKEVKHEATESGHQFLSELMMCDSAEIGESVLVEFNLTCAPTHRVLCTKPQAVRRIVYTSPSVCAPAHGGCVMVKLNLHTVWHLW
jgi:hypothetical protein